MPIYTYTWYPTSLKQYNIIVYNIIIKLWSCAGAYDKHVRGRSGRRIVFGVDGYRRLSFPRWRSSWREGRWVRGWLEEGVGRWTGLRTPDSGRPSDPQKHERATDVEGHITRSRGGRIVINKFLNVVFSAAAHSRLL